MKVIHQINPELTSYLNIFKDWALSDTTQKDLYSKIEWKKSTLFEDKKSENAASIDYLNSINHDMHDGFPPEMYGLDLNYEVVKKMGTKVDAGFMNQIRDVNYETDDKLQTYLGAKLSALKAFYPAQGYIAWHTNWNAPGYNIIFTYSPTGNGYWRHVDPSTSQTHVPDSKNLVHIDDIPGWHCKAGYFGTKSETNRLVWHSAYTREPRVTLAYVLYDEQIWKNLVQEIEEGAVWQ